MPPRPWHGCAPTRRGCRACGGSRSAIPWSWVNGGGVSRKPIQRRFWGDLGLLAITIDRAPDESRTLALARQHRLTVYDAAYLELAQRAGVPLATLDGALQHAAARVGVPLLAGVS